MSTQAKLPRQEHPRPDFRRNTFFNLNGEWQFTFDDEDVGLRECWYREGFALNGRITVPFCYQCKASGIGDDEAHAVMWYRRAFDVPGEMCGKRVFLRFGAVDYRCAVYVNGEKLTEHEGGYTPFGVEITHVMRERGNDLCLRVQDDADCTQPRGKQYWEPGLMGCWYTPSSGVWQTVYLEAGGENTLTQIHITPDIDRDQALFELALEKRPGETLTVEIAISFGEQPVQTVTAQVRDRQVRLPVCLLTQGDLSPVRRWTPEHPNLYDARVSVLRGGEELDQVHTYFGMRKIERRDGQVLLNNSPLYQRLVLDQGYWPDTLLTPPSDEAIQEDIRLTLKLGFNGARKHQKLEDPRYYYWADRLGLLVWGEVPSAYDFADESVRNLAHTLESFIDRDFNHPCLICWVPLNESWGVRLIRTDSRQQAAARMLYWLAKAADGTRLVSSNDGWEQVETDICALHDYAGEGAVLREHFSDRETVERTACDWRMTYAGGAEPDGREAFMVTEYGGVAFVNIGIQGELGGMETWGYNDKVQDEEAFFNRYQELTDAIRDIPYCQGYCYTQLTDVMQEINGVLTPDRQCKVDAVRFAKINRNPSGRTNHCE